MDRLGYHTFWMAEHHFQREGYECIPNVLMFGVHLAQVTPHQTRLRLQHHSHVAPAAARRGLRHRRHPHRGRVTFGVGRGYHTREVETFGAPLLDQPANRELFEEQVDIIFKAFNEDSFSHKGKHYTLPPEVPYRGYTLKELTLVPRPLRRPVECWQPIQGGTPRALDFMAKHGIQGVVGGGSAEGGAMHKVVLAWQEAHARAGKQHRTRRTPVLRLPLLHRRQPRTGRARGSEILRREHEDVRELRLVRALTEEQIEIMRDPVQAPIAKLPRIDEAIASGGFLCGSPAQIIDHLKALGKRNIRALDRISVSLSVGVPKSVALEQLERFATEVMPAFQRAPEPAMAG